MKILTKISLLLIVLLSSRCSNDEGEIIDIFGAAFDFTSINLSELDSEINIPIVFNKPASKSGTIVINYTVENAIYDTDFNTVPATNSNNKIVVSFSENDLGTSFVFNKLQNAVQGENKIVIFEIEEIIHPNSQISGNTTTQISFIELASLGTTLKPSVGGPNENNSVFIDLSSEAETVIRRDTWDLGFYSGNEFRVMLNGTIAMGAGALSTTDIDAVNENDSEVINLQSLIQISTNDGLNVPYFDASNGNIDGVVISDIFTNDNENKVYLVNLGFELSNEIPEIGSAIINGDFKGWKKIRVLRNGDDYVLQYANLNDTTHQEITISKKEAYNFSFFNFDTNSIVDVEPEKQNWDLHFTPHNKEFLFTGGGTAGFIFFSDMVLTNTKNNVSVYLVEGDDYEQFSLLDVDDNAFSLDHTTIGSDWRSVFNGTVTSGIFFVLKDTDGNIYKIEFTALLGTETDNLGQRGYPQFRYKLLE